MNEKAEEFLRSIGVTESNLAKVKELMQDESKDAFEQGFDNEEGRTKHA